MPADSCPRCSAPLQATPLTPPDEGEALGCTRCTWPNPSYMRVMTVLAKQKPGTVGYTHYGQSLQEFADNLPKSTTLKDPKGRVVAAKVVDVKVQDGQVEVVFEFDPNAWVQLH